MLGDINFFKEVNDHLSHRTGDQVLRELGRTLRQHVCRTGVVARYGGEEFAIPFPDTAL